MISPVLTGIGVYFTGTVYHGDKCLFEALSLELVPYQWTCLLGPSGVGKSTILRLLAGLPIGGEFNGEITAVDGLCVKDRISYMAQSDLLFPWLNVKQNIILGQRLRAEAADDARADELIRQIGLWEHRYKRPDQLSGGMRQRVALARTLMENTPVILLDEPFSALDARTRADMQELAFSVLKGKTVLLVTHDPSEAVRLSHQLYLMSQDGVVVQTIEAATPIRAIDDPRTLKAQADLLLALKSTA